MSAAEQTDTLQLWQERLRKLIDNVKVWAIELDWSTREIQKPIRDAQFGIHQVPALLMQKETTRILLEPYARTVEDYDGSVDLYLLPGYDDIASFYHDRGGWLVFYQFTGEPLVSTLRDANPHPLSKDVFGRIIEEMWKNAAQRV